MKEHTDITERKPLSDHLEPDYAALLEEEHLQWKAEAAALPPMGVLVTREIAAQQAVRRKRQRYALAAAVVFVLLAVGTVAVFTIPSSRTAATQASASLAQHIAEAYTSIRQAASSTLRPVWEPMRTAVHTVVTGDGAEGVQGEVFRQGAATAAKITGMAKKTAAVVAGLPAQVWYMLFLAVGVGVLLAVDFLVRTKMAHRIRSGAPMR